MTHLEAAKAALRLPLLLKGGPRSYDVEDLQAALREMESRQLVLLGRHPVCGSFFELRRQPGISIPAASWTARVPSAGITCAGESPVDALVQVFEASCLTPWTEQQTQALQVAADLLDEAGVRTLAAELRIRAGI